MKNIYFTLIILGSFFSIKTRAQCSTPTTIPYYESFQSITTMNQLPSCWAISNPSTCGTSTGSTGFAFFYYQPAATSYFYSKAIQLSAGIVYSVSVFYTAGFNPTTTWSDLSLLLNQSQSAVGASTLVSTNGFAMASVMTNLSNTFTVPNSGVYYIAVKGTSNGTGTSQYLSWDDLSITIPCQISPNSPSISILANSTIICQGTASTFTATGANSYTWNNGATTPTVSYTSGNVNVMGTNTLTGCVSSASINVSVNPAPNLLVFVNSPSICEGASAIITAVGASFYTWSSGQQTNSITVSPSVSTVYTVTGSNNSGCTATTVQFIQVNPLPTVSAFASTTMSCAGDSVTLYASGALNYQWTGINAGNVIGVFPAVSTIYTVNGTNAQGCSNTATVEVNVSECTGINSNSTSQNEMVVSPNPFQNEFLIRTGSYELKTIVITDINGRVILDMITKEEQLLVNTRYYAQGIYYVKISTETESQFFKMIRN